MNYVIWFFSILTIVIFWVFFLYPYLQNKYTYWKCSRILKNIANNTTDEETKIQINEIVDQLRIAFKEEKLGDTLNEAISSFGEPDDDNDENKN